MITFRMLLLLALFVAGCGDRVPPPASAPREASVKPGINDEYRDGDIPKWQGRFETESREVFHHRQAIVDAIGVKSGQTVADVGAGTGLFTLLFAERVGPSGHVIAQDIFQTFLEHIAKRASDAGASNVRTLLGKEDSPELPPASCDVIFVCDVYHHFEYPKSMLAGLKSALRPGGKLVIVDFERIPGKSREWILGHVRAGKQQVLEELAQAGFSPVEHQPNSDFFRENYLVVLEAREPDRKR